AYRKEGEWQLSLDAANRIGMVIGAGTLLWIYCKVPRTPEEFLAAGVPWPAALLPLLAPLLPILLMVKLFRPKTVADFWAFQTISLVTVTLACFPAGKFWFFLLLGFFFASLFWCLPLFCLHRERLQAKRATANPFEAPLFEKAEPPRPAP